MNAYIKDDFKNLLDYKDWVNNQMPAVAATNSGDYLSITDRYVQQTIKGDKAWFGAGTTLEELKAGITEYKNPALIDKLYDKVEHGLSLNIKNRIKAKKINYNALGLGVFMFDRAAMGMYQLDEFFSPSMKKKVEPENVQTVKGKYYHITDRSPVIKRKEQRPDGKPKVRTINKNVFAYFPETYKDKNAVELFLSCGGNSGITAEEFLYSGITAIIIAELLTKARIKVKINVVIGTSRNSSRDHYYACIVPVKNYDETLDRNVVALLSSDPRFYRYDGFKGIMAVTHHFGQTPFIYYGADGDELKKVLENSNYAATHSVAQHRYYFGRTFSESAAIRKVNETITDLSEKLSAQ